jgi:alpha-tubulin suppressor-like RCC1 family protein
MIPGLINVIDIAVSSNKAVFIVDKDGDGIGTLNEWNFTTSTLTEYSEFNTVVMVSGDKDYFLFLLDNGTVWSYGTNTYGQLGHGDKVSRTYPQQIFGLSNIVSIDAGQRHAVAINDLGIVYSWGNNQYGRLGMARTVTESTKPVAISNNCYKDISAGYNQTVAISCNGDLWMWGWHNYVGKDTKGTYVNNYSYAPTQFSTNTSFEAKAGYDNSFLFGSSISAIGGNTAGKLGDNSIIERHAFVTVSNSTYSSNYAVITPPEAPVTVQETSNDSECKPGNGNGDTNHCHSGAPGKSK